MEKQELKLGSIQLSQEMIDCIKNLQEPGPFTDTRENNYWLNNLIERLSSINGIIVKFYLADSTVIKPEICMETLTDIEIIKKTLLTFAVPEPEKQPII